MGIWSQQISGDILDGSQKGIPKAAVTDERQKGPPLMCPRCESTNTKFCYYNNYSRTQPRHYCRACQRHWTVGGTLRNVPVGGGRKNKRQKTSHSTTTSTTVHPLFAINASPPLVGELEEAIFPDVLRRVLLRPQAVDNEEELFGNSLQNDSSPLLTGFGGFDSGTDYTLGSIPLTAAASSCSSASSYSCIRLVESSPKGSWFQQLGALPASYWDVWDGSSDFNDPSMGQQMLPK